MLVVNKYSNLEQTIKAADKKQDGDMLMDIVVMYEIGFVTKIGTRSFIKSHLFGFNYCVDIYDGNKSLSFDILACNPKTQEHCFWKYYSDFYKPDKKSQKITIDNSDLSITKTQIGFKLEENASFLSLVENIKKDLWATHEEVLANLNKINVVYDSTDMDSFSENIKRLMEISYSDIEQSEMANDIKRYHAQILDTHLPMKENIRKKPQKV